MMETAAQGIKDEVFEKNTKACFQFGRRCEFFDLCHKGDNTGLTKQKRRGS